MRLSDITKIKVGDQLRVYDTDIIVRVHEIDHDDPEHPIAVRSVEDIAFNVHQFKPIIATSSMMDDDICWLYTSVLDVLISNDIGPKTLKRMLDSRQLVTLESLEIIEPQEPETSETSDEPTPSQELSIPNIDEMRKSTETHKVIRSPNEMEMTIILDLIPKMAKRGYNYCSVGFDISYPVASMLTDQGYTVNGRTISW